MARPPLLPEDELEDPDALSTDYLINRMKRDLATVEKRVLRDDDEAPAPQDHALKVCRTAYKRSEAIRLAVADRVEAERAGRRAMPMTATMWARLHARLGTWAAVLEAVEVDE